MSDEQEKKMDQMLDKVAKAYAIQAPVDLARRVEEALVEPSPRLRGFRWQPVMALLVVGISAGVLLDKMKREDLPLGGEMRTPENQASRESPTVTAPVKKSRPSKDRISARAGDEERVSTPVAEAEPPPSSKVDIMENLYREANSESAESRDPAVVPVSEGAAGARPSRAPAQARPAKASSPPAEARPAFSELVEATARSLEFANIPQAMAYWNAAVLGAASESQALPRARDIQVCKAWLAAGQPEPVLRFLKTLAQGHVLSVEKAKLEEWISLVDKGDLRGLDQEWKGFSEGGPRP